MGLQSNRGGDSALKFQEAAITVMTGEAKGEDKELYWQSSVKMVKSIPKGQNRGIAYSVAANLSSGLLVSWSNSACNIYSSALISVLTG